MISSFQPVKEYLVVNLTVVSQEEFPLDLPRNDLLLAVRKSLQIYKKEIEDYDLILEEIEGLTFH